MLGQKTISDLGHFNAIVSTWPFCHKTILTRDHFGVMFNLAGATFQSHQKFILKKKKL